MKVFVVLSIFAQVFLVSLASTGNEGAIKPSRDHSVINMEEPPFWLSSFEEFSDLRESQKEFYLKKLDTALDKVPALKGTTIEDLATATKSAEKWGALRLKIYEFCAEKAQSKVCENISEIRLQALDMFANQKEENRKAAEKSSAPKRK